MIRRKYVEGGNDMVLDVCVGSSCHQKGSYDIIQALQRLIKENNLESKIELKASFCLGHCSEGVSMRVDGEPLQNVSPENIEEIFKNNIMTRI